MLKWLLQKMRWAVIDSSNEHVYYSLLRWMCETLASLHVTLTASCEASGSAILELTGQMADRGWTESWSIILVSVVETADIRVTEALHFQGTIKMLEYSSSKRWVLWSSFLKEILSSTGRNRHLAQGTVSNTERFVHWMKWRWSHLQVNSDRWQGRVHSYNGVNTNSSLILRSISFAAWFQASAAK